MSSPEPTPTAAPVLRSLRGRLAVVGLLSALVNLLMLNGSLYMLQVHDRVMSSHSMATLMAVTLLLLFLFAVQGGADLLRQRLLVLVGREFSARLRGPAHAATLRHARGAQPTHPVADLDTLRQFVSGAGPSALLDLPWVPVFMLLAFLIHPAIGAMALGGAIALSALTLLAARMGRAPAQAAAQLQSRARFVLETERAQAQTIRAMGLGPALTARHDRAGRAISESAARSASRISDFAAMSRVMRLAVQSLVLGLGAMLVIRAELSAGAMIASSILVGRALAPIDGAIAHWRPAAEARAALRRLDAELSRPEPVRLELPLPSASLMVEGLAIGPGHAIAAGIGFAVSAGDILAVIGPSGAGKTTLLRALAGIEAPLRGTIRLDGVDRDQHAPDRLARAMGYVGQDPGILEGTVAENISRMAPDPDPDAILNAAQSANAHAMILSLPQGYDTPVGDATRPLSGGQRQRLALARAFYGAPFLLLLDEANANLDAEGDAAFARAVQQAASRGAIVVMATHRMQTIGLASHVLLLEPGGQKAFGPRAQLLRPAAEPLRATA